jgi:hypothetical protein
MRANVQGPSPVHPSPTKRSPFFYSALVPRNLKRYYSDGDLCHEPQWRWGRFRSYANGEPDLVRINDG